jgi:hypothetical protein
MAAIHGAANEYSLTHDDIHALLQVDHLTDADPADLRDLPGALRAWAAADQQAGVPERMAQLKEDLEAADSLEMMAERWAEWADRRKGWSPVAKLQAAKIKDACKLALQSSDMAEVAVS